MTDVRFGDKQDRAPSPFDTTTYIVAAARLGFSAANAMRIAEDLYMNGFILYPRTDNTVYPASLDIEGILKTIRASPFKKDVEWVMANRRAVPTRGKKSSTDHPPIHPTGAATRELLGEDIFRIYQLVLRRFLATLAPDARWKTLKVLFDAGGEDIPPPEGNWPNPAGIPSTRSARRRKRSCPRLLLARITGTEGHARREGDAASCTLFPEQTDPADGRAGSGHQDTRHK